MPHVILAALLGIVLAGGVRPSPWTPAVLAAPGGALASQSGQNRPTSTPYTGDLSIFDMPGRAQRLQIDRVMDLLHIRPGTSVADRRVGPDGQVWAEDINPMAVRHIAERAQQTHLGNIRTVLGTPSDPRLPDNSVNAVLMLKMYHEIARPIELLEHLRPALRPAALVGVIDRNGSGSGTDHGVREETVVHEMSADGFHETGRYDFVKADGEDYLLLFQAD